MSQNNLEPDRAPIPNGEEPEEAKHTRRRWLWIPIGIVIIIALGAILYFVPRRDTREKQVTYQEPEVTVSKTQATAQRPAEPTASPEINVENTPTRPAVQTESTPGAINRIVFISPDARIGTVAPDGSDLRYLTDQGRFFQFPAWSPINDSIAAIGSDFESSGIFVVSDQDQHPLRQLYADNEFSPIYLQWSPDGQSVSFIAQHPDGLALQLAPTDGSGPSRVLATTPGTFFWSWHPDSRQVLIHTGFTARDSDLTRLAFIPVDDSEQTEIPQSGFFQAPGIAQSGNYYSYGDTDPLGNHWLSVWELETNQQKHLSHHEGVVAMGWSPTNSLLAHTSPALPAQSFYGPLRLLDLTTGTTKILVPETVLAFFWSPDGQSIAYLTLSRSQPGQGQSAGLNNQVKSLTNSAYGFQNPRLLAKPAFQDRQPVLFNLLVVDVTSGEQRQLFTFEPTDKFVNQFLPFFDQYAQSHQVWSPDSSAVVLPVRDNDGIDTIVVIPVNDGRPEAVAFGEVAFWSNR